MKCPPEDLLSAYHDREIGSPWDARIAAHVSACACCREKLESFRSVSACLREAGLTGLEESAERVRQRIAFTLEERADRAASGMPAPAFTERHAYAAPTVSLFKQRVLVPVPVLAGGLAALFILVASLFFFVGKNGNDLSQAKNELETLKTIHVLYPVQNPSQLYKAISARSGANEAIVLDLPEGNNFNVNGQPEVIYVKSGE